MTTAYTIHTIQDLIRILEESPEWKEQVRRQILTDELLNLPVTLAAFVDAANKRFDAIEARLDRLESDVATLKDDVATLKDDVATLKDDVATLKDDVGMLRGDNLELKLHRKALPLLSQRLRLRRVRLIQNAFALAGPELMGSLDDANDAGVITEEQYHRVFQTDAIVYAVEKESGAPVWIGVEISAAVHSGDITRAQDTAVALADVFNQNAVPVVIGYRIDPRDQALADRSGVVTLILDENA